MAPRIGLSGPTSGGPCRHFVWRDAGRVESSDHARFDATSGALSAVATSCGFSGVVARSDLTGTLLEVGAFGARHRAEDLPNTAQTRFGIASGTKAFTAATVAKLVGERQLTLDARVGSFGPEFGRWIDPDATLDQLLNHMSGCFDYFGTVVPDEVGYRLPVSAEDLDAPSAYLALCTGSPKAAPGEAVEYANGGYVALALIIERATGGAYGDAVTDLVLRRAGMGCSGFFRSDDLPSNTAVGYMENGRSNVFRLPVRGGGDGGMYTTVEDMASFWAALLDGRLLGDALTEQWLQPVATWREGLQIGRGFLHRAGSVFLDGWDLGVGFMSVVHRDHGEVRTLLSNDPATALPVVEAIRGA